MLCMILCGGLGKRMRGLTNMPKVLLEIRPGLTLLDYQLEKYRKAGFSKAYLLTAYGHDLIRDRYGEEFKGLKLEYVHEGEPRGTLNAIRLGLERANQDVMVSNGDVIAEIDLQRMWREFKGSNALASVFVTPMRSPYGVVQLEGSKIVGFKEKPLLGIYINGGYYCLRREVLPLLEEFREGDIERTLFPKLASEGKMISYKEEGNKFWISVDTPKDLDEVRKRFTST